MILRDPVHGLVAFESEEDAIVPRVLEAAEVQRLRRIRQLGLTSLAFPGAEHTRFSHAIGAAHVMQRLVTRLRQIDHHLPFWQRVTSERARDAIAAALLHDLGHGPLSHLFEEALPGAVRHERWTRRILCDPSTEVHQILVRDDPSLPSRVADLIDGRHELPYLAHAVSGLFDVDRCDYLLRDAQATGVGYGEYDLDWLLRSLRFEPLDARTGAAPGLAIDGLKGITAIESFLLARLFMFQQVYFHKSTRAAELMIRAVVRRAVALLRSGATLPARLPALEAAAAGVEPPLDDYLALDDGVLLGAMRAWEDARDPTLADLCRRLRARALFKTIELSGVESDVPADEALAVARDVCAEAGLDPEVMVGLDVAEDVPFSAKTELRVIFPDGRGRELSEVSFLLGRLRGERLRRVRLVFAPELRPRLREALALRS
jgi:HD superfamily phosphohydrolase